jgi:hypothetical protein
MREWFVLPSTWVRKRQARLLSDQEATQDNDSADGMDLD